MSLKIDPRPIWAQRRPPARAWDPPFSTGANDMVDEMFSVILPVCNGAACLARAVDSVQAQTYRNLEILIVDDGSTDESLAVARRLASQDPRIKGYAINNSGGPARPRNHAIERSRGEFIAFLDQDDWWLPRKLERQLAKFRESDYAVVYSDAVYQDALSRHNGSLVTELPEHRNRFGYVPGRLPEGQVQRHLITGNFAAQLTVAVRVEWVRRVGKMDESAVGVDCYEYLLRLALAGGSFGAVFEALAVHDREILSRDQQVAGAHSLRFFKDFSRRFPEYEEHWAARLRDYEEVLTQARMERIRDGAESLPQRMVTFYELLWLHPSRWRFKTGAKSLLPKTMRHGVRAAAHRARNLIGPPRAWIRRIRKTLGRALPERVKRPLRGLELSARDRWEILLGTRDALVPPMRMLKFIGSDENFRTSGDAYLRLFRDLADLKQDERVLDVGCGVGRMAVSLTDYLNSDGSYDGFDCWKDGITWCNRNISRRYPNFRFRHMDVYNGVYNPTGGGTANELTFPYPDCSFDFVTLTSVFTHMLPGDVMHYLREIRRVLRPGGRVFVTWFLLDDDTRAVLRARSRPRYHAGPWLDFRDDRGNYWTTSANAPESAVAYDVGYVRASYEAAGLTIKNPIRRGEWPGRPRTRGMPFQDVIVADRSAV